MGIVIAIDGVAASGKGTLGRALAREFGFALLDTGKLYRAVAAKALDLGISVDDAELCGAVARSLTSADIERNDLGTEALGSVASKISSLAPVRAALLEYQRAFAEFPPNGASGVILDGRDIGTVICPNADAKFFLTADVDVRAKRRVADERAAGRIASISAIAASIRKRDEREANRAASPTLPACDAILVDTSHLTSEDVFLFASKAISHLVANRETPPAPTV